jgi:hypothetical protein
MPSVRKTKSASKKSTVSVAQTVRKARVAGNNTSVSVARMPGKANGADKKAAASGVVDLCSIKCFEQFPAYYAQKGLTTTANKIKHLIEATGVKAIRGTGVGKQKETLASLEEFTMLGHWRFLNGK